MSEPEQIYSFLKGAESPEVLRDWYLKSRAPEQSFGAWAFERFFMFHPIEEYFPPNLAGQPRRTEHVQTALERLGAAEDVCPVPEATTELAALPAAYTLFRKDLSAVPAAQARSVVDSHLPPDPSQVFLDKRSEFESLRAELTQVLKKLELAGIPYYCAFMPFTAVYKTPLDDRHVEYVMVNSLSIDKMSPRLLSLMLPHMPGVKELLEANADKFLTHMAKLILAERDIKTGSPDLPAVDFTICYRSMVALLISSMSISDALDSALPSLIEARIHQVLSKQKGG